MNNSFSRNRALALVCLTLGLGAIGLCGCSNSANSSVDKAQDLARLKNGPTEADRQAMREALKNKPIGGGPPRTTR